MKTSQELIAIVFEFLNENSKYANGKVEKNDEPLTLINAQSKGHFS